MPAAGGTKHGLTPDDRIEFQQQNPKRAGSAAFLRYDGYKGAKTVAAARGTGGWEGDLKNDHGRGYMKHGIF